MHDDQYALGADEEIASLNHLASLAAERGVLCASPMAAYQWQSGMNDDELAARLHCSLKNLVRLRLCEVPRVSHFQEDRARLAAHVSADAVALAELFGQEEPQE